MVLSLPVVTTPYKWWKLDFNFNFFHADIDGSNIINSYKATTYSWFARQTSRFMFPKNFDIQVRGNYEAPQKTAQGTRKALYYLDFRPVKMFLRETVRLTFNVLDVFNSRRNRYITYPDLIFLPKEIHKYRRRQINLTLNYRIRQSKQVKKVVDE